nr:chorismate lyase [Legionella jordanis]
MMAILAVCSIMHSDLESLLPNIHQPPTSLLPWLTYPYSLTDKLKEETGQANLLVLKQEWKAVTWWDKFTLGLVNDDLVFHREILMSSANRPCWYARTIIPESSHRNNQELFARLKQESLGVIVFNNSEVRRKHVHHYSIDFLSLEYYWLTKIHSEPGAKFWARFSVFTLKQGNPFYLVEIFLPELLRIKQ